MKLTHALVFAIRRLRTTPWLTCAAIVCLGIGAASAAAIATFLSAALLRPLPFPHADRLVRIWFDGGDGSPRLGLSHPELADFATMRSVDLFISAARVRANLRTDAGAERVRGEGVSLGYFDALAVRPALGRVFDARDHDPQSAPALILSHGAWRRIFGADASVVGRVIRTDRAAYTVVGVAAPAFDGSVEDDIVDFFIPIEHYEPRTLVENRRARSVWVVARLHPGISLEDARRDAEDVRQRLAMAYPEIYEPWRVRVEPMGENWRETLRGGGVTMGWAAAAVLLIASINLTCLLLARTIDRQRELAIRVALGSSRRRMAVELGLEGLVIVGIGGAAGVVAGPLLLDAFLAFAPPGRFALPRYLEMGLDWRTLAFAVAGLGTAALVTSVGPALLTRHVSPVDVLRGSSRSVIAGGASRWWRVLVGAEVAATVIVLLAAALLIDSYGRLDRAPLGYDRDRIARLAVTLSPNDYGDASQLPAVYARLQSEVASVTGAARVGLVHPTLPPYVGLDRRIRLEGVDLPRAPEGVATGVHLVNNEFLPMLGAPLRAGRTFILSDMAGEPAAIISETLARHFGGAERSLGRSLFIEGSDQAMPAGRFTVVGVAANVAYDGLAEDDSRRLIVAASDDAARVRYDVYVPLARYRVPLVSIGVWTPGDPGQILTSARQAIARIAPSSAIHWVATMDEDIAAEYAASHFFTVLIAVFAALGLALTGVGIFALLSHAASRRAGEVGLRLALGAAPHAAVTLVLGASLRPVAAGVLCGAAGSVLSLRFLESVVYGSASPSPWVLAGVALVLCIVSLAAAAGPARRLSRISPASALRGE